MYWSIECRLLVQCSLILLSVWAIVGRKEYCYINTGSLTKYFVFRRKFCLFRPYSSSIINSLNKTHYCVKPITNSLHVLHLSVLCPSCIQAQYVIFFPFYPLIPFSYFLRYFCVPFHVSLRVSSLSLILFFPPK